MIVSFRDVYIYHNSHDKITVHVNIAEGVAFAECDGGYWDDRP
jgi:hypothetical protein